MVKQISGGCQERDKDEKAFEEQLNDSYGAVEICGMTFDQGTALKELDPVAFRCALSDAPLEYECKECGKIYPEDEYDDAEKCCSEFQCEICNEVFSYEYDAIACEKQHEEDEEET